MQPSTSHITRLRDALGIVETLYECCAMIDSHCRVIEASNRFIAVAERSTLFRAQPDGTLDCANVGVRERIAALLCEDVAASPARRCAPTAELLLVRSQGKLWRARAARLPEADADGLCLLTIEDLTSAATPTVDARLLAAAFNLTQAEASVSVDVAEGRGLRDVAAKRNVSYQTVRNQAKSIFNKTGCSSQAELASMFARLFA